MRTERPRSSKATRSKKPSKKPTPPAEFPEVGDELSQLLTLCFDVLDQGSSDAGCQGRGWVVRAALAHGADVRSRLRNVYERAPHESQIDELKCYAEELDIEPDSALKAMIKEAWPRHRPYVETPARWYGWYVLAGWIGDKPWQTRLRAKLVAAVRDQTLPGMYFSVGKDMGLLEKAEVKAAQKAEVAATLVARLQDLPDHFHDLAFEQALRSGGDTMVEALLPKMTLEPNAPRWAVELTLSGRPSMAQELLDRADAETVSHAIERAGDSECVVTRRILDALAELEGDWGELARSTLARRTARLSAPEDLERRGVEWFFNVQGALDTDADDRPPITPQIIMKYIESHLATDASASDKVRVRAKAVELLAELGAYEDAAALAKVVRRKLGSSKYAKQSERQAWASVAAVAARQGRWDVAIEWATKLQQAEMKGDAPSVADAVGRIGRGILIAAEDA